MLLHITNERAMFDDIHGYLIISDLHLGLEYSLNEKGFKVPDQFESLLNKIFYLKELTDANGIIILGDVKHEIGTPRFISKLKNFFNSISKEMDVIIIKGNHDGSLENYVNAEIHEPRGFLKWNLYLTHGHTWPLDSLNDADYLLMGHIHPEIKILDQKSNKLFNGCWLKSKPGKNFKKFYPNFNGEIIIFPAFNPLVGMALKNIFPGPLFNNKLLDIKNMDVYLLDSTYLGKYKLVKNLI